MQDLVAVSEIAHPTAEYWATLSHLDVNLALSRNEIRNGSSIFYFSGCLNILLKLLLIFLVEEVLHEERRFEFLTPSDGIQEAREVLFTLCKGFLGPLSLDGR